SIENLRPSGSDFISFSGVAVAGDEAREAGTVWVNRTEAVNSFSVQRHNAQLVHQDAQEDVIEAEKRAGRHVSRIHWPGIFSIGYQPAALRIALGRPTNRGRIAPDKTGHCACVGLGRNGIGKPDQIQRVDNVVVVQEEGESARVAAAAAASADSFQVVDQHNMTSWLAALAVTGLTTALVTSAAAAAADGTRYDPSIQCNDSEATGEYPRDVFTCEQKSRGAIVLHCIGLLYMFCALAIVCDEFFVPSLSVITRRLRISNDVAGATFMAAGGSAPELATSFLGSFVSASDVGIGTIVGSAVFNILFVLSMCAFFSRGVLQLTWWPLFRDCCFYMLSLTLLMIAFRDASIDWYESVALLACYAAYVLFMKFNEQIETRVRALIGAGRRHQSEVAAAPTAVPAVAATVATASVPSARRGAEIGTENGNGNAAARVTSSQAPSLNGSSSSLPAEIGSTAAVGAADVLSEPVRRQQPKMLKRRQSTGLPILHSAGVGRFRTGVFQLMTHAANQLMLQEECDGAVADAENGGTAAVSPARSGVRMHHVTQAVISRTRQRPTATELSTVTSSPEADGGARTEAAASVAAGASGNGSAVNGLNGQPRRLEEAAKPTPTTEGAAADAKKRAAEDELENSEPMDLTWPGRARERIMYVLVFPIAILLWLTLADVRKQIMGLTFLAAGTSVPDLITSVVVARQGLGDMAVSSSVGSNIFDVTIGLPLPWLIWSLVHSANPVSVNSRGAVCSVLMLFGMLACLVLSIAAFRWRMSKGLGVAMLCLYAVFLAVSILTEYDYKGGLSRDQRELLKMPSADRRRPELRVRLRRNVALRLRQRRWNARGEPKAADAAGRDAPSDVDEMMMHGYMARQNDDDMGGAGVMTLYTVHIDMAISAAPGWGRSWTYARNGASPDQFVLLFVFVHHRFARPFANFKVQQHCRVLHHLGEHLRGQVFPRVSAGVEVANDAVTNRGHGGGHPRVQFEVNRVGRVRMASPNALYNGIDGRLLAADAVQQAHHHIADVSAPAVLRIELLAEAEVTPTMHRSRSRPRSTMRSGSEQCSASSGDCMFRIRFDVVQGLRHQHFGIEPVSSGLPEQFSNIGRPLLGLPQAVSQVAQARQAFDPDDRHAKRLVAELHRAGLSGVHGRIDLTFACFARLARLFLSIFCPTYPTSTLIWNFLQRHRRRLWAWPRTPRGSESSSSRGRSRRSNRLRSGIAKALPGTQPACCIGVAAWNTERRSSSMYSGKAWKSPSTESCRWVAYCGSLGDATGELLELRKLNSKSTTSNCG
uniref:Na_Ca_ex domain-containing protein n=1 Tax=Macrostomum lignano TaxID=282301 RepID=A0A1I8ID52_9PLAT